MRNYYADYALQYESDTANHLQPQLSSVVAQGIAYCASVLRRTAAYVPTGVNTRYAVWKTAADVPYLTWRCRRALLRDDFTALIDISNAATQEKLSPFFPALRPYFLDVDFSPPPDVFYPLSTTVKTTPATVKMLSDVLNVKTAAAIVVADMLNSVILPDAVGVGINASQPVLLSNALLPITLQTMLAQHAGIGPEYVGLISKEQKFSPAPPRLGIAGTTQYRFGTYRKMHRASQVYLPYFDFFLTAITDFCRLLEVTVLAKMAGAVEKGLQSTDRDVSVMLEIERV